MKNFAISDVSTGRLNAMVKTIMKQMDIDDASEAVRRVNSGEWIISNVNEQWTIDDDGIIYFELPITTGITGSEWSEMLKTTRWSDELLNSDDFWVTNGKIYKIAIIPRNFFSYNDCNMVNIKKEIDRRGWLQGNKISPEVACLIQKHGIAGLGSCRFVIMHEPIRSSRGDLQVFNTNCEVTDILGASCPGFDWWGWDIVSGFVCVVSQYNHG